MRRLKLEIDNAANAQIILKRSGKLVKKLPPYMIDPRVLIEFHAYTLVDRDTRSLTAKFIQLAYPYGSIECRARNYTITRYNKPVEIIRYLSNPVIKKIERMLCYGKEIPD